MSLLLLLLLVALAGGTFCTSYSKRPIREADLESLKPSKTTRKEVESLYGKPYSRDKTSTHVQACHLEQASPRPNVLYVEYNQEGVLVDRHVNDAAARSHCDPAETERAAAAAGSSGGSSSSGSGTKTCMMDTQCGAGQSCTSGVCTGGIVPKIHGRCVTGTFGERVCSNTGKKCWVDSECF